MYIYVYSWLNGRGVIAEYIIYICGRRKNVLIYIYFGYLHQQIEDWLLIGK